MKDIHLLIGYYCILIVLSREEELLCLCLSSKMLLKFEMISPRSISVREDRSF